MLQGQALISLITEYVEEYTLFRDFSKNTLENKRDLFARFLAYLGDKPFTLENVQLYANDMKKRNVSANSIGTEISNIKAFVRWLIGSFKKTHECHTCRRCLKVDLIHFFFAVLL